MSGDEQETLFEAGPARKSRPKRQKDELFEALAFVCGIKPSELTVSGRGQLNKALGEIKAAGATPPMILERGNAYRERFQHIPTPPALARHWASLSTRPVMVVRSPRPAKPEGNFLSRSELAQRARAWAENRQPTLT